MAGEMDALLKKVQQEGWTERLAAQFEAGYGRLVRWLIVVHMERLGIIQGQLNPYQIKQLPSKRLELFENTLSDLWIQLLDGLVPRYLEGVEKGKIHHDFRSYLSGVIRHLVLDNAKKLGLVPKEAPREVLQSICKAKGDKERRARVAWAKFCFEGRVRFEILSRCPPQRFNEVYRNIHHVVDYFFERFLPGQCDRIAKHRGNPLHQLIERFLDRDLEAAVKYRGTITPYAAVMEEVPLPDSYGTPGEEELASPVGQAQGAVEMGEEVREVRLALWDRLLRGEEPTARELSFLSKMGRDLPPQRRVGVVLLLAAVELLRGVSPAMRRNLKAWLRYQFSRAGPKKPRPPNFDPRKLAEASLVDLIGLYLSWPEAMLSVGGNPNDYSALKRLEEKLRKECKVQWERLFGPPAPSELEEGGD